MCWAEGGSCPYELNYPYVTCVHLSLVCIDCLYQKKHLKNMETASLILVGKMTIGKDNVGRAPLDEWSVHRRDLYLKQTSMPPAGFEPLMPGDEKLQTHAFGRVATGNGTSVLVVAVKRHKAVFCWIWISNSIFATLSLILCLRGLQN